MKKLLLVIILFLGIQFTCSAQNIELKVATDSTLVNGNYTYSINLTILGLKAPYRVDLFNHLLSNKRMLITSKENINESTIRFDNLPKSDALFIYVESTIDHHGITTKIRL